MATITNTEEVLVSAVKHNERRNGKRCAAYWSITSKDDSPSQRKYDTWFARGLRKMLVEALNQAPPDPTNWGLQRGTFKLVVAYRYHDHHIEPTDVVSIEYIPDTRPYFVAIYAPEKHTMYPSKFRAKDFNEAIQKVTTFLKPHKTTVLDTITEVTEAEWNASPATTYHIND